MVEDSLASAPVMMSSTRTKGNDEKVNETADFGEDRDYEDEDEDE